VVVCDGKIIGEGWHRQSGEPHAEVLAIRSVNDPNLLAKSTIYVALNRAATLEKHRLAPI
jgi:diaminohydroxyphosphoribosylaminopyrimidine deaminase/5-amino-6-(5-phosphoribosylamino)uracil reductase